VSLCHIGLVKGHGIGSHQVNQPQCSTAWVANRSIAEAHLVDRAWFCV